MDTTISEIACLFGPLVVGMGSAAFVRKVPCRSQSKWMPPSIVFAIVWPLLYLALGFATLFTWQKKGNSSHFYLLLCFIGSLVLWWIVFANVCAQVAAFATIIMITGLGVATCIVLRSWLVGIVVIWLSFASYLARP